MILRVMASTRDGLRAMCVSECRSHPLRDRGMCTAHLVTVEIEQLGG